MMHWIDWVVLLATLLAIVLYGVYKGGRSTNISGYLLANRAMPWYVVGLGAMATQASAITFLSTTGQGYEDGMRFVQFYFGLPLAMVVLCITAIPLYHRLKVYTAYEYLEGRFDLKTRVLTASIFALQRGLSNGISLYAPALVLSAMLGVSTWVTTLIIGGLVILYTLTGGAKAVGYTQTQQMLVIWGGLFAALYVIVSLLPDEVGLWGALEVAGHGGRLNAITLNWDWNDRYTLFSGLLGGFFLQLSYFGTDQSQVQRYLTGRSVAESRLGLIFNGLVKIPMQVVILFIGAMVFVFYQFNSAPLHFNPVAKRAVYASAEADAFKTLERSYDASSREKSVQSTRLVQAIQTKDAAGEQAAQARLQAIAAVQQQQRAQALAIVARVTENPNPKDSDYVFLSFVMAQLPTGLVGLIFAVIFSASMSSIGGALSALASTSTVDFYKRLVAPQATEAQSVRFGKYSTLAWGIVCIIMANYAASVGNMIEAVNIMGSLVYGVILGVFVVAFYLKHVGGHAVFWGGGLAQGCILALWLFTPIAFLWYNLIGCALVVVFALLLQATIFRGVAQETETT